MSSKKFSLTTQDFKAQIPEHLTICFPKFRCEPNLQGVPLIPAARYEALLFLTAQVGIEQMQIFESQKVKFCGFPRTRCAKSKW